MNQSPQSPLPHLNLTPEQTTVITAHTANSINQILEISANISQDKMENQLRQLAFAHGMRAGFVALLSYDAEMLKNAQEAAFEQKGEVQ